MKIDKIRKAVNEGGLSMLIYRGYRYCMIEMLPEGAVEYNGFKVMEGKKFGFLIPGVEYRRPDYEEGTINAQNKVLGKGDKVVIVGGGYGVTAVNAKQLVGEKGEVTVFEPAGNMVGKIKETASLNHVGIDQIIHAAVGKIKNSFGKTTDSKKLSPQELPECGVLELDCEGEEIEILEELEIRPRNIIVESHGMFDCSTEKVKHSLRDLGYKIINEELAEPTTHCIENDIKVITASESGMEVD